VSTRTRILDLLDRSIRIRCRATTRGEPSGVLLVRSGGLGDTILFSHVLPMYLKLAGPGETLAVLTPRASLKTTFLFPQGVEVIGVDFPRYRRDPGYRFATARDLYERNVRLVVSTDHLRHPWLDESMIRAAQAPEMAAMAARRWPKYEAALAANRRRFTRLFDSGPDRGSIFKRWVAFANWLTGSAERPPLPVLPPASLPAAAVLERPTVVFQPFSAVPAKQPAAALWEALADAMPAGWQLVVTGAPDDPERNPGFASLLDRPGVRFDPSGFREAVPLLRAARLVVSADTALMHLAVAVGAPTLCLASAAYVGEIVPYPPELTPPNVEFVHRPMPCEGCRGDCTQPLEGDLFACVAGLERRDVIAAFHRLLEKEAA
jgi:ADP-heptose:LPS heptosyltransferase